MPASRRLKASERRQAGAALDRAPISIKNLPSHGTRQPEPGIIGRAAADPDQATLCAFANRYSKNSAQSGSIELKRMELPPRQHRQTDHAGSFDDRRAALRLPPPRNNTGTMRRVHRSGLLKPGAD